MRRGVKRAVIGSAAVAVTSMLLPTTAALATVGTTCTSSTVDLITVLNFQHCYKNNGYLATTINDVVLFKAGNNDASVDLSNGISVLLQPGGQKRWSTPGVTVVGVEIFN
jgi:hypothetical protein